MKNLIYVCLLALVAVSFGCEKEELYLSPTEESIEISDINEKFEESNSKSDTKASSTSYQRNVDNSQVNYYDENGNPVETYSLYLDMDYIEANYNGQYFGSFSQHYFNEMSNHFTIHTVEYANASCGNIERWVVSKEEYDIYVDSIGGYHSGVSAVNNGDGNNNSSTSSGSSNTEPDEGWGDEDGNVTTNPRPRTNPDDDGDVEPKDNLVPTEYEGCF